jgi:hypothetical protein
MWPRRGVFLRTPHTRSWTIALMAFSCARVSPALSDIPGAHIFQSALDPHPMLVRTMFVVCPLRDVTPTRRCGAEAGSVPKQGYPSRLVRLRRTWTPQPLTPAPTATVEAEASGTAEDSRREQVVMLIPTRSALTVGPIWVAETSVCAIVSKSLDLPSMRWDAVRISADIGPS